MQTSTNFGENLILISLNYSWTDKYSKRIITSREKEQLFKQKVGLNLFFICLEKVFWQKDITMSSCDPISKTLILNKKTNVFIGSTSQITFSL